jgi:(2Fe-2S) ferredoxin
VSCTVTVCRDCCCGTTRKHPGVDHDAQLRALQDGVAGHGRVVVSQCLLACERSNVVVVAPDRGARGAGARPVWLDGVLDDEETSAIVAWVRAGGPGHAPVPTQLEPLVGRRPALLPADVC